MAGSEDFSGLPFIAGSLTGQRVWMFSPDFGHLMSPMRPACVWDQPIMESNCNGGTMSRWSYDPDALTALLVETKRMPEGAVFVQATRTSGPGFAQWTIMWHAYGDNMEMQEIIHGPFGSQVQGIDTEVHHTWNGEAIRVISTVAGEFVVNDAGFSSIMAQCSERQKVEVPPEGHNLMNCSCGFYAYYAGEKNSFDKDASVIGVVEGFGETVVGTKGFRSSKARILALAPYWGEQRFWLGVDEKAMLGALREFYPQVPIFKNSDKMFREFPVTKREDVM